MKGVVLFKRCIARVPPRGFFNNVIARFFKMIMTFQHAIFVKTIKMHVFFLFVKAVTVINVDVIAGNKSQSRHGVAFLKC